MAEFLSIVGSLSLRQFACTVKMVSNRKTLLVVVYCCCSSVAGVLDAVYDDFCMPRCPPLKTLFHTSPRAR